MTREQKVGQRDSFGTVSSSLYPGFEPSDDLVYWPMITFLGSIAGMPRSTRTCNERQSDSYSRPNLMCGFVGQIPFRHEYLRPRTRAVVPSQGGSTPAADLKPGKGFVLYKTGERTGHAFVVVERTVLHDVSYDPKLVKVAAPALCPERLLEGNLLDWSEWR